MLTADAIKRAIKFDNSYGGSRQHFFGEPSDPNPPLLPTKREDGEAVLPDDAPAFEG